MQIVFFSFKNNLWKCGISSTQNYYTEECENLRGHIYENIGIAHFTALHFTELHRYCFLQFFYKCLWQPCQASLLVPFFQQYLLTSCLCVTFW